ncbi:hypothetical protein YM304_00340 [Ilumatobacter coccineus YM16-304]|uniref:Uncharacterized protein n=1 Tax=Ilumatobacter coccineus (strain NBRC 103263 / KCTC 29153 / YM16-304) TaxID=1313172 RepID=A0A6C7E6V7_ILUCY|nr:hypothetical protein YM304_00340 [Ilumatobacter coccineus YM16-304]
MGSSHDSEASMIRTRQRRLAEPPSDRKCSAAELRALWMSKTRRVRLGERITHTLRTVSDFLKRIGLCGA